MTPKHYQSTLNYKENVLSLEECPYYKLSEQSPTKLTSVQKPRIRFQYANTYKCGEREEEMRDNEPKSKDTKNKAGYTATQSRTVGQEQ